MRQTTPAPEQRGARTRLRSAIRALRQAADCTPRPAWVTQAPCPAARRSHAVAHRAEQRVVPRVQPGQRGRAAQVGEHAVRAAEAREDHRVHALARERAVADAVQALRAARSASGHGHAAVLTRGKACHVAGHDPRSDEPAYQKHADTRRSAADAFAHAWQPSGAQAVSGHGQAPVRQADRAVRLLCRRGPGAVHRGVCAHPAGVRLDTVQGATGPRATHGDTRRQCCRCILCRHARSSRAGPAARLDGGAVEGHAEHAERPPRGDGPVRAVAPVQEAAVRARRAHLPPGCAGVGRRAAPCPCPAAGQPTLLIALRMSPARRRDT